jgi:hypothetical protein
VSLYAQIMARGEYPYRSPGKANPMECGFRPLIHLPETEEGETEMARPNWEYVRLDVLMPENPKVSRLSDKAFRTYIELLCYCGRQRTDGLVDAHTWKRHGNPRARRELLAAGLVDALLEVDTQGCHALDNPLLSIATTGGCGVVIHDYLEHNRSRLQIDELAAKRAEAGRKGGSKSQASA